MTNSQTAGAPVAKDTRYIEWRIANLDCENEAIQIRRLLGSLQGVQNLRVFPQSAKIAFEIDERLVSIDKLREELAENGFPVLTSRQIVQPPKLWQNRKVVTSAISGVILGIVYLLELGNVIPSGPAFILYAIGSLIGGYYFGREAAEELFREFEVGIELLMGAAAIAAFVLGMPAEGLTLVFLYSISEALESYTEAKTRSAVRALMDLSPKSAIVQRNGQEFEIPVEEIAVDDIFVIRPGQSIPTDGVVVKGHSSIDQAPVTGESVPVEKSAGDNVFAGTINSEGALEVRATRTYENNTLARIIHLVEEAQEEKGKSERFIRRFGKRYSPAVLLAGILIAVIPGIFDGNWLEWAVRATVFVVAAAPCALVISIPITMVSALGTAARNGVLVKGGVFLEEMAKIKVVALDKTGTITMGRPSVTNITPVHEADAGRVVRVAAAVERMSQHPLAKAVVEEAIRRNVDVPEADAFRSYTGMGASAYVEGTMIFVGSPLLVAHHSTANIEDIKETVEVLQQHGESVILVASSSAVLGIITLRDTIRPNAREAIDRLREEGVEKVIVLTGDHSTTASAITREVGADEFRAELTPEDKSLIVKDIQKQYGRVLMVGDGVNDAPALAVATVGVAMGVAGTDVAMETAHVALMGDDLSKLSYALRLAHRTRRVVRQNLFLSMAVISLLVIGALGGYFTLPIAVLGHELSELAVIASGLRLLKS